MADRKFSFSCPVDRLNDALQAVIRSPVGFAPTVLAALRELTALLDCQFSILTFQNPVIGPGFTMVYPQSFPLLEHKPAFEAFIDQHPHRKFYRSHEIEGAAQFSDIISRRKLERLDLYQVFFKPLGIRHLVAQSYETAYLEPDGLKLPEAGVYNYAKAYSHLSRSTFSMASGHDARAFTAEECALFHRFCQSVCLLLQREMRVEVAMASIRQDQLHAAAGTGEGPAGLARVIEAGGLTLAQSRVLRWLAVGKTNAEIAIILGNSERTIEVHVEAILKKLGVENRVAAASVVWSGEVG